MANPSWPSNVEHRPEPTMWAPPLFTPPRGTPMEGGNTRRRVKPGDAVAVSKWGQKFTDAQFAAFRSFYRDTLINGSLRFTMPVCLDGVSYENRVVQIVSGTLQTASSGHGLGVVSFDLRVFGAPA